MSRHDSVFFHVRKRQGVPSCQGIKACSATSGSGRVFPRCKGMTACFAMPQHDSVFCHVTKWQGVPPSHVAFT